MKLIFVAVLLAGVSTTLNANSVEQQLVVSDNYNYLTDSSIVKTNLTDDKSALDNSTEKDKKADLMKDIKSLNAEENLLRRAEIIFFGSLTFVSFFGWLFFSTYNTVLYGDTFGTLKRYQFFSLYLGCAVVSFSVSISDLFIRLQKKNGFNKKVIFF